MLAHRHGEVARHVAEKSLRALSGRLFLEHDFRDTRKSCSKSLPRALGQRETTFHIVQSASPSTSLVSGPASSLMTSSENSTVVTVGVHRVASVRKATTQAPSVKSTTDETKMTQARAEREEGASSYPAFPARRRHCSFLARPR